MFAFSQSLDINLTQKLTLCLQANVIMADVLIVCGFALSAKPLIQHDTQVSTCFFKRLNMRLRF